MPLTDNRTTLVADSQTFIDECLSIKDRSGQANSEAILDSVTVDLSGEDTNKVKVIPFRHKKYEEKQSRRSRDSMSHSLHFEINKGRENFDQETKRKDAVMQTMLDCVKKTLETAKTQLSSRIRKPYRFFVNFIVPKIPELKNLERTDRSANYQHQCTDGKETEINFFDAAENSLIKVNCYEDDIATASESYDSRSQDHGNKPALIEFNFFSLEAIRKSYENIRNFLVNILKSQNTMQRNDLQQLQLKWDGAG